MLSFPLFAARAAAPADTTPQAVPRGAVALVLAALVLLWALPPVLAYQSPPWDNVEELFWAQRFQWGYYKHPPLPTWIMAVLVRLAGPEPWLTYAAGVGCGAGALYLLWRWARECMPPQRALLAVVLASLVAYHLQRTVIFNHNTVQLLPLAGYWWMLWRTLCRSDARARHWVALGVFAALSLLTKYSAVVQFAVGALLLMQAGRWREPRIWRGLVLSATVALLLILPHLVWALTHSDQALGYAAASVEGHGHRHHRTLQLRQQLGMQIGRLLPMLVVVAVAFAWRARGDAGPAATPAHRAAEVRAEDARFLAWAAFGPVVLVLAAITLLGTKAHGHWFTTFFLPLPLWLAMRVQGLDAEHWRPRRWAVLLAAAGLFHAVAAIGGAWDEGGGAARRGHITRGSLPSQQIADRLQQIWHARVPDRPLPMLVGDTWFAGAVALRMGPQVQLWIDGEERTSPWIAPGALEREGGMVVILDTQPFQSEWPTLETRLAQTDCQGRIELPWVEGSSRMASVRWGLVLPRQRAAAGSACPPTLGGKAAPTAPAGD
ncbi:glycosyltransferase family 39 protein [uncultured Pseudacidovorax sp.]|uniref:glycosyltransferase family 39 protein n=1 Tax=uncultured Pseudacidovorax sp. TaxID=679313 RepID=UPI0025CF1491|nr:glycosyltransferase family 39 protein [uncultured Pseudacidovorax sp.]